jgi:transcriptional regulator with PAS, ATPase and Fis domain
MCPKGGSPRSRQRVAPAATAEAAQAPLDADSPSLGVLSLRYIHRALKHMNNKTRVAELLGIDRGTLNRILARERQRTAGG